MFDIDSTNEEILHLPWSCVVYALSPQREAVLHDDVEPSDTQSASLVLRNGLVLLIRSLIILFGDISCRAQRHSVGVAGAQESSCITYSFN